MKLHDLAPDPGSRRPRKRLGLGNGGKGGTYAGRGTKGQGAREGGGKKAYFEGGQLPFVRRLPFRRGFKAPFRVHYTPVNLGDLDSHFSVGAEVTAETLKASGLLSGVREPYKILAEGSLSKALKVHAPRFGVSARSAIEEAGGECLSTEAPDLRAILRHRRPRH
ncbi:MAG: 50S ribosomal protein L15 [Anaerolineae bacterium]|nr:50S ribosomal protein L15 [Ardenticatenia bacterium]HQZ71337.1 50S ribosomal protein L15 [Anaerolineae bacterium]HRA19634.1 50S ribosomal protein L15 [Anaerolineae bacterium]